MMPPVFDKKKWGNIMNDIYVEGYGPVSDTVDLMKLLSFVFSEIDANTKDDEQN